MEENKRYWNTVSTTITAREGVHKFPILYCTATVLLLLILRYLINVMWYYLLSIMITLCIYFNYVCNIFTAMMHYSLCMQLCLRNNWITGHSMGGHGAWHLATHYPDMALAVVSLAGWIRKEDYGDSNLFFRLVAVAFWYRVLTVWCNTAIFMCTKILTDDQCVYSEGLLHLLFVSQIYWLSGSVTFEL